MKKEDPLADELAALERTVATMRRLGVVKYGDVELGPSAPEIGKCVHGQPRPGACAQCEADENRQHRVNLPRLKRFA